MRRPFREAGRGLHADDGPLVQLVQRAGARVGGGAADAGADAVEHVLDAAPLVAALLSGDRAATVLVTSRAALRVSGEREVPVLPLALPTPSASAAEEVGRSPAVTCGASSSGSSRSRRVNSDSASTTGPSISTRTSLTTVPTWFESAPIGSVAAKTWGTA